MPTITNDHQQPTHPQRSATLPPSCCPPWPAPSPARASTSTTASTPWGWPQTPRRCWSATAP